MNNMLGQGVNVCVWDDGSVLMFTSIRITLFRLRNKKVMTTPDQVSNLRRDNDSCS